jgi:FAD/FMN-containing dehydrogenase
MLQRRRRSRLFEIHGGILEIDPARRIARVEPGVVLDQLRAEAEKHHLTFAPDPATHDRCTLGGMIGNNSCGVHSIMAGKTDDNIESLEVLTYGGMSACMSALPAHDDLDRFIREGGRRAEIYAPGLKILDRRPLRRAGPPPVSQHSAPRLRIQPQPPAPGKRLSRGARAGRLRRNLRHVLEATCRLVESPPARVLLVVGLWPDIYQCADHIPEIMEHRPIGLEGFDDLWSLTAAARVSTRRPRAAARRRRLADGRVRRHGRCGAKPNRRRTI